MDMYVLIYVHAYEQLIYVYIYIHKYVCIHTKFICTYVCTTDLLWLMIFRSFSCACTFIYNFSYCSSLTSAANNKIKVKQHQKYKNKHKQREWEAETETKKNINKLLNTKWNSWFQHVFLSFILLFCLVWMCAAHSDKKLLILVFLV